MHPPISKFWWEHCVTRKRQVGQSYSLHVTNNSTTLSFNLENWFLWAVRQPGPDLRHQWHQEPFHGIRLPVTASYHDIGATFLACSFGESDYLLQSFIQSIQSERHIALVVSFQWWTQCCHLGYMAYATNLKHITSSLNNAWLRLLRPTRRKLHCNDVCNYIWKQHCEWENWWMVAMPDYYSTLTYTSAYCLRY